MAESLCKVGIFSPYIFKNDHLAEKEIRYCRLMIILDNLVKNGLLLATNDNWIDDINSFLGEYSEEKRDFLEFIKKRLIEFEDKNKIVTCSSFQKCYSENEWIMHVNKIIEEQIVNYDFILATKKTDNIQTLDSINESNYGFYGGEIRRHDKNTMVEMLEPIFAYAESIKIIDPYFRLTKKSYWNGTFLKKIFENTNKVSYNNLTIDIHTSIKVFMKEEKFEKDLFKDWQRQIKKLENVSGHKITAHVWENHNEHTMHDRYIISNQCGLSSGRGMSPLNFASDSTWGVLGWDASEKIERQFIPQRRYYRYIGEITSTSFNIEQDPISRNHSKR